MILTFLENFLTLNHAFLFSNFLENLSYCITFDNNLDFSNNLLNLPLPASERMNSLVILYLEVSYITMCIFFIVSFVLLETILVHHSSTEWNSSFENKSFLSFNASPVYFTAEEEPFTNIFAIKKNLFKPINYTKRHYTSFIFYIDKKDNQIDIESDILNLRLNEEVEENHVLLFQKNENIIYDFLVEIRLLILKQGFCESVDVNNLELKMTKENVYEFYDIKKNKLIFFISFFYRKKIVISINNNTYDIYCVYYVSNRYSLDFFNCIRYKCSYIYFDVTNNTFLFDKEIDNSIFETLVKIDIENPPHTTDHFLYDSLLKTVFFLFQHNFIIFDKEYENHFFSLIGKQKLNGTSTKIESNDNQFEYVNGKENEISFDQDVMNFQFNKEISEKDIFLFKENEEHLFNFMISKQIESFKEFIIYYYDFNRDEHINIVNIDNIIAKKKINHLYEFYLDTDIINSNLLYYLYIFHQKKIDLYIDNSHYKIYCLYLFHDKFFCFSDFSNILYRCVYIYYDVTKDSFLFDNEVDLKILDQLIKMKEDILISDKELYQSLLSSICDLANHDLIKINDAKYKEFIYTKNSYKHKNQIINTTKKSFHTTTLNQFNLNSFFLMKSIKSLNKLIKSDQLTKLDQVTKPDQLIKLAQIIKSDNIIKTQKIKLNSFLEDSEDETIKTQKIKLNAFIEDSENKISGFFNLRYIKFEELDIFFHIDVKDKQFYRHKWILLHNNVKLINEDGQIVEGYIMGTASTHKGQGEISNTLKLLCPSFWNEKTRLYYLIYFFEKDSLFKETFVDFKKNENLNFTMVHNYLATALDKNMGLIICAKTNKPLYSKDNVNFSKLSDLGNKKNELTCFKELYCNKDGYYIKKSDILPIKFNFNKNIEDLTDLD